MSERQKALGIETIQGENMNTNETQSDNQTEQNQLTDLPVTEEQQERVTGGATFGSITGELKGVIRQVD